ncbi:N/A [soil metagenome]
MRVMLLSDMYPPVIGGIELHVRNLARGLSARGHEVSVVTMHHEGQLIAEHDGGVSIHRLRGTIHRLDRAYGDMGRRYAPPVPDPGLTRSLWSVIRAARPQVVHGHNWLTRSFLPLKGRSGARLLATLHDYGLVCAKRSLVYRERTCEGPELSKCLGCAARHYGTAKGMAITLGTFGSGPMERRAVDLFMPVSNAVASASRLAQVGAPFEVIPNFVPDDVAVVPPRTLSGVTAGLPDRPYILYVGALTDHKGVPQLLAAYQRLERAPPLVLIGTRWPGSPTSFPTGTTVLTDVPHADVMQAWRGSLFGVIPSTFPDPCPTVAMEAMATGRALIASASGGLPDLVDDGATGVLVRPRDVNALTVAMKALIDDPVRTQQLGEGGLRKVADFMSSRVVARIEAAYSRVLASSPA